MKSVITLQNGKKLNANQFISYFEKKVFYTIRKYNLLKNEKRRFNFNVQELLIKNKIGNTRISHESLDDISLQVFEAFMIKGNIKKKIKELLPIRHKNKQIIIRPFYFMTKKEIKIYAKLKNIALKKEKRETVLSLWLNDFEKRHLEVKNAIVNSILRIEESSARLRSTNESCHHH